VEENIYNIFLDVQGEYIEKIGVVEHEGSGSDKEKLVFLQKT